MFAPLVFRQFELDDVRLAGLGPHPAFDAPGWTVFLLAPIPTQASVDTSPLVLPSVVDAGQNTVAKDYGPSQVRLTQFWHCMLPR